MTIRNQLAFTISMLLVVVLGYFIADRLIFLAWSERTTGTVTTLAADNDRCGSKSSRHSCTRYQATVRYYVRGEWYSLDVGAGRSRGHDQPLSLADYHAGDEVPVVYSAGRPQQAYRDSFWDVWSAPLMTFFFQISALFGSFRERKSGG